MPDGMRPLVRGDYLRRSPQSMYSHERTLGLTRWRRAAAIAWFPRHGWHGRRLGRL